jgi:superfamily II DNA or RNA helicase
VAEFSLRDWQKTALNLWQEANHRGIVEVVTGGGKTVFALACVKELGPDTTMVVVPTLALLDQWWEEAAAFFNIPLDDIHIVTSSGRMRKGTINIAVLNSAAKLAAEGRAKKCFLIIDECHKAGSVKFRDALDIDKVASLGLSATPERPYDEGLKEVIVPALGSVIYQYTYRDALRDGVIVPFALKNIVFDLEEDRQAEYDKLTKAIARSIQTRGMEDEKTVALLLRRARVLNLSLNRIRLALRIVASHNGMRTIIFHEDIEACEVIKGVLIEAHVKAGIYHSKMKLRERADVLSEYRKGNIDVLVTCRALDEGFNVPETQIGIIAASTATRRQRIQRLGRVLRPVAGKAQAIVYTLIATSPEIQRLREEERELNGVAEVSWGRV